MEFHETLQHLRRRHGLTQEQLAEKLYVSRTAVSKWESGRGYPNLDSLKSLSRLFGVSLDELLSNEQVVALAEEENRTNLRRVTALVFGALDVMAAALLFLPLFGQREGDFVRAVTLWHYTAVGDILRVAYGVILVALAIVGIAELCLKKPCKAPSLVLHAAAILLFTLSRQPYMTACLFLLFLVKVPLLIQEKGNKA